MAAPKKEAAAEPTIIVKRIYGGSPGEVHHGGAWKVAYADFATAMMAFFMLLWIVGATTEKQRKGIADYFAPTLVKMTPKSSGSNGLLAGRSMRDSAGRAPSTSSGGKGMIASIVPREVGTGMQTPAADRTPEEARREASQQQDRAEFVKVKAAIDSRLAADKSLTDLRRQIRYTETREGLRIEIIDRAGFSMFALGTDRLVPRAARLMASVATGVIVVPNPVAVRGHTDALGYANAAMNNWKLSTARAEATREAFQAAGIPETRFARIEGVAAREPFYPANPTDPRNRRITVTLFYREPGIAG